MVIMIYVTETHDSVIGNNTDVPQPTARQQITCGDKLRVVNENNCQPWGRSCAVDKCETSGIWDYELGMQLGSVWNTE